MQLTEVASAPEIFMEIFMERKRMPSGMPGKNGCGTLH